MRMSYLNRELLNRLDQLSDLNKELLTQFLSDIGDAKLDSEKQDAVSRLRSKVREYVSREENI
jgi:hypothetical protein